MAWQLTENLEKFLTNAGGFLCARPAANTVLLRATELLRASGPTAYGDATPLFGWRAGAEGTADAAFAASWQERTGQAARTGMRTRLYALDRLLPPAPPPPGAARTADAADRDLLLAWLDAFQDEAQPGGPHESQRVIDHRIGFGGLVLWEHEGRPVSLAGRNRAAVGQARVGPVYTPGSARPRFRQRGDGRRHPARPGRRRRGRGPVHRPLQPHE